ncbi:hypothetical protein EW146_g7269 [Bondarzewia mesenterica]|uniref:Uncharacterized protein n=1 Tax=Bondarzewia mesenterica TaxID=1095465 RepID=A0A4S4LLA2_9AGAM|nr:hypothetical protein EW146_g7269 [Bondarzewia mesenterica]
MCVHISSAGPLHVTETRHPSWLSYRWQQRSFSFQTRMDRGYWTEKECRACKIHHIRSNDESADAELRQPFQQRMHDAMIDLEGACAIATYGIHWDARGGCSARADLEVTSVGTTSLSANFSNQAETTCKCSDLTMPTRKQSSSISGPKLAPISYYLQQDMPCCRGSLPTDEHVDSRYENKQDRGTEDARIQGGRQRGMRGCTAVLRYRSVGVRTGTETWKPNEGQVLQAFFNACAAGAENECARSEGRRVAAPGRSRWPTNFTELKAALALSPLEVLSHDKLTKHSASERDCASSRMPGWISRGREILVL